MPDTAEVANKEILEPGWLNEPNEKLECMAK